MSGISKRVSGSWVSGDYGIMKTATDTITTLPANLYADGNNATVGISGNMVQNGTQTPDNPIYPSECGDLETTGEHAGQYKIPISSASTTTPVYLGEVESTRQIKKLVLTGEENWNVGSANYYTRLPSDGRPYSTALCTHAKNASTIDNNGAYLYLQKSTFVFETLTDFKSYLAAQYTNGTPVTVWYILATETTGIVNEPLMKIGDYADEVSGITIPTIAGENTISVDTTLHPSEVTVNYKGWHPVADVHERENGQWN